MKSLKTLRLHLDAHGIRYAQDKSAPRLTFTLDLGDSFGYCAVECTPVGICFSLRGGVKCPPHRLDAMMRFVAQANWGLSIGRFDLNVHTGEVMYQAYVACTPNELTDGMLEALIGASLGTYGRYASGLGQIVWTDADPDTLIHGIENPQPEEDPEWEATMERLMADPPVDAPTDEDGPALI